MNSKQGMFGGTPPEVAQQYRSGIQRIPRAMYRLDVPIIAAVNGPAIGAGCDLACMCDLRIAALYQALAHTTTDHSEAVTSKLYRRQGFYKGR